jgi:hypothetical protein
MFKKMGMTLAVVGAITLAGCGVTPSSEPTSSGPVDPALAKMQAAYDSLGGLIADPTNITTGFQVPITLANGVTATWTSAEPGVLSFSTTPVNGLINATVNRPARGNGDATFNIFADLSIAAELTAGNLTQRWTQPVTVKQSEVDLVVINSIADILALKDPSLDRTLNVTLANLTIFARSGGEAFAYDGTGIIQIYRGAAESLTVGKVYTISGLIDWYFGIWEIVDSTAEEQVGATPRIPTKEVITGVLGKVNRLSGEGAQLPAGLTAAAGNFEPIYARVTGKVAIIADRPANYNTYILDKGMEPSAFVAGAGSVPANALLVYYQTVNYDLIKAYNGLEITIDVVIYTFRSDQRAFAVYYVGGPTGITANLTDVQAQTIDAAALSQPAYISTATTLTLPTTGINGGSNITWSSSNSAVINPTTGVVTISNPAVAVTLTATIQKGTATAITRRFEIAVGQLANTTMAALLTKSARDVAYSEAEVVYLASDRRSAVLADATGYGYIFNSVALNITLGQFIGVNYIVGVFRGLVQMTAVQVVTPKGTDPNITPVAQVMTATQALPYTSATAWAPALVTMELVGFASGNFTNGYLAGFGTRFVQTNGAPSTLRDKKFTVTGWITGRGSNTPAQSITLISTLNYDTVVAAATNPTDAEKLALSVEQFIAPAANNAVTSNLTLPTTAAFGTIAWTSDTPSVISNSGVVNRPAVGQPDATVKLSYVITVGSNSTQPVQITYVVKAQEPVPAVTLYSTNFGTSAQNGYAEGKIFETNGTWTNLLTTNSSWNPSVHAVNKNRVQIATSSNIPHDTKGAFLVFAPISGALVSYMEFDLTSFANARKLEFEYAAWSATSAGNITGSATTTAEMKLQRFDSVTSTWIDEGNALNLKTLISATEYKKGSFSFSTTGKFRVAYTISGTGLSTSNTTYAVTFDNLVVTDK